MSHARLKQVLRLESFTIAPLFSTYKSSMAINGVISMATHVVYEPIYIFLHKWGLLLWITSALRHPKLMGPSYSLVLRCQNILEYLDHIRTLNEMWLILWTIQSHGPWVLGLLGFGPWDATACRRRRWTWKKIVSSSCGNLGCTWPKNTRLYRMKLGVSFELLFHLLPYCFLL